jgi:hypothetical protein
VSGAGLTTEVALLPMRPVWSFFSARVGAGSGADIGATGAAVMDFVFAVAGLGLNATRLISACGLAAVL